jgi:uncharacterized protein
MKLVPIEVGEKSGSRFGYLYALAWTLLTTLGLWLCLSWLVALWPRSLKDIALLGLVQVLVYSAALALFVRARGEPARKVLGLRAASPSVCLLSALLGVAIQAPTSVLADFIERVLPSQPGLLEERALRLTPTSTLHALTIAAIVIGGGPLLEELFFRGALFGALERTHARVESVLLVACCFALAHLDPRLFLPLFLVGLALSYVRALTGSIWPGLFLHATFNGVTLALVFAGSMPGGRMTALPHLLTILGSLVAGALIWAIRTSCMNIPGAGAQLE